MGDQYDRTLIRLSSTEDDKLDPILTKLLPLVFEELLTQTEAPLRLKIVGVLNHVLTRAKGNTAIKLPAKGILEKWFSPKLATSGGAPFFRNLSVIFLDLSVPRLQPLDQIDLALSAMEHFNELQPGSDRVVAFIACIAGLGAMASEGIRKEQIPRCLDLIAARAADDVGLVAFFRAAQEFLLIPCGSAEAASVGGMPSASWAFWKVRLKNKTAADMVALKASVLRWLGALGAQPPASLVYLPSLVATAENYDLVCNMAESNCKRLDPELDLHGDELLLGRMICSCLTSPPPGQESPALAHLRVEAKATVPSKLKIKVMSLLQRSKGIGSPTLVTHTVHLICQSLKDSEQVQQSALSLALVLVEHIDPACLAAASATLLEQLEAVFWPGGGVVAMGAATPMAFRTYGAYARQLSENSSGGGRGLALQAAPRMLSLLSSNEQAAQDILEALSGLVSCMRSPTEQEYKEFVPLLDKLVTAPRLVVRREVLRWASTLFPTSAPESRYYALRLLSDPDADVARAAENLLSSGGREVPNFGNMCTFLAARALNLLAPEAEQPAARLKSHLASLKDPSTTSLPNLSAGFAARDLARALGFLLALAEKEGLRSQSDDSVGGLAGAPPQKKPRLVDSSAAADDPMGSTDDLSHEAVSSFLLLLDYLIVDVEQGNAMSVTEALSDDMSALELVLRSLLLAARLANAPSKDGAGPGFGGLLEDITNRAELMLFGRQASDTFGALFREGGSVAGRCRRLGARVAGELAQRRLELDSSAGPLWLPALEQNLAASAGEARQSGASLAICELLRAEVCSEAETKQLCKQIVALLMPGITESSELLAAVCDGLRRVSERRNLVWKVLGEADLAFSREQLLDRLYGFSKLVTDGLGDTKEAELGASSRDLIHASWRLLGQLAAWEAEDSSMDCVEKLIAIGLKSTGEEALGALGLALSAGSSDPTAAAGEATPAATVRTSKLIHRLLELAGAHEEEGRNIPTSDAAKAEMAAKERAQRCGIVWLTILLRRMLRSGSQASLPAEYVDPICRSFVRAAAGLSIFVADCSLKGMCLIFALTPPDGRTELMKTMFASISNRTVVSNMFVGTPDTATRKEMQDGKDAGGPNSLKITAKERVDLLKDLMFLSREMSHPPLFIGLLDQPVGSIWTGEILREALDLQMPSIPDELHPQLCPKVLRPKLYPFFFHSNGPLRQAVVALTASYFSVESPQQLATKFSEEWPQIARNLVAALGSGRVATREAAVHAAQALFRGKVWSDINFIFEDLWSIAIRLMDDMEERVQAVVKPFMRMMRNLTLRLCDTKLSNTTDVEAAIKTLIPLLLTTCERYTHAQPLCFDIIREMIKLAHNTNLLSAYVQDLIPPLLVSLSMMENTALQYWQFHIEAADASKGRELEAARVSNSRDSESMKLIRQLVPLVTEENAAALAPRTRDSLARGVGANTRVGACDLWIAICAERPSAVPTGGQVATSMLRCCAGALLDQNREVRNAAASCFASLARRNTPQELTRVVSERLLQKDAEFRTDDAQRNAFRVSLARALWEVCRRCDDGALEPELKASIAAKAFGLRWSSDQEVKTGWEPLWSELCPTTSGGVERHHKAICKELASAFEENISRAEKMTSAKAVSALAALLDKQQPRPNWATDAAVGELQNAVRQAVQNLPVFEGSGLLVRALADIGATMHRRKRNEPAPGGTSSTSLEESLGFPLIKGFSAKGSLTDRAAAIRALQEVTTATRLWQPLEEPASLYAAAAARVDELQKEVENEKREPGEAVPKRHRGKGSSPAEELLSACLDFWGLTFEQCRLEEDDDGDLSHPEDDELKAFMKACLDEFSSGSLTFRLDIVRLWKHLFAHFAEEKLFTQGDASVGKALGEDMCKTLVTAIQDASLDARSERLRRPALELAGALSKREKQREVLETALAAAAAAPPSAQVTLMTLEKWIDKVDDATAEICSEQLSALRALKP